MSTAALPRPSVAIQSAANCSLAACSSYSCPDCEKAGLALLLTAPTVVPQEGASKALRAMAGRYQGPNLFGHLYVLRALPQGYVYVLKADKTWDAYVVDAEGLLRVVPPYLQPQASDVKPMFETCKRKGDNIPAQVLALDPERQPRVWIAFSHHRWSRKVLEDYANNKDGQRDKRMVLLDVKAAAANGAATTGHDNPSLFAVTPQLGQHVADYAAPEVVAECNKHLSTPLQNRGAGVADTLAKVMAQVSANTPGKTGCVLVLPDPLGVTIALNESRNRQQKHKADVIKKFEREAFVMQAATALRQHFKDKGEGTKWSEVYDKAYSHDNLASALNERDGLCRQFDARMALCSVDWLAWIKRPGLSAVVSHDYDTEQAREGASCAIAVADCLHGATTNTDERSIIQSWLKGDVKDPSNVIWKGLAAANKSLLDRLADAKDLMPPSWDSAKNGWSAADEFVKSLKTEDAAFVARIREGSKDPVAHALARLFGVVTACADQSTAYLSVVAKRMVVLTAVWAGARMAPLRTTQTTWQAALEARHATWGAPSGARVQRMVQRQSVQWHYDLREVAELARARGGFVFTHTRYVIEQLWRGGRWVNLGEPQAVAGPETLRPGSPPRPQPATAPAAGPAAPRINTTPSAAPEAQQGAAARGLKLLREGGANVVLAGGVLYFQLLSFAQATADMKAAPTQGKFFEALTAYYAAMSAMTGATLEIVSAKLTLGVHLSGTKLAGSAATAARGMAVTGGLLGSVGGVAMGISSFIKAGNLEEAGDIDAAKWTQKFGWISIAGALTGGAAALTASGAAAAEASAAAAAAGTVMAETGTASLVGGTLLGIGPAGWALLTVGLVITGFWLAYKAGEATDDPLESWLKQSVAGKAPKKFETPADEIAAYNSLFSLPLDVAIRGSGSMGRDTVDVRVSAPRLDTQSRLEYQLTITDARGTVHVVTESLALNGQPLTLTVPVGLQPGTNTAMYMTAAGRSTAQGASVRYIVDASMQPAGERDRATGNILRSARHSLRSIGLLVKYRPLSQTAPEWVLPSETGQAEQYTPA